jgi:hypothetical protein
MNMLVVNLRIREEKSCTESSSICAFELDQVFLQQAVALGLQMKSVCPGLTPQYDAEY